jgi:hypothetical protein
MRVEGLRPEGNAASPIMPCSEDNPAYVIPVRVVAPHADLHRRTNALLTVQE